MQLRRILTLSIICALAICPLLASSPAATTLTVTITGTLGPVLSGSDPLGANGQSGMLTITANEGLSPTNVTKASAQYDLPPAAISVALGSFHYVSTTRSRMMVKLTKTADILTVVAGGPLASTVVGTFYLAPGSWNKSVLTHPATFQPSPQTLTAASAAGGAGSQIKYTVTGSSSVLGLTGSASSSAK